MQAIRSKDKLSPKIKRPSQGKYNKRLQRIDVFAVVVGGVRREERASSCARAPFSEAPGLTLQWLLREKAKGLAQVLPTSFAALLNFSVRFVTRTALNSASSFECFRNMALRLLVNSAVTLRNSAGDLIAASL
jgi:hypothetical protein